MTNYRETRTLYLANVQEALVCAESEHARAIAYAASDTDAAARVAEIAAERAALQTLLTLSLQFITGGPLKAH